MGFFLCTQCRLLDGLPYPSPDSFAFSHSKEVPMKIAFITRATLYKVRGGDTLQVIETARHLQRLGIEVDIRLTHEEIDYSVYDLLHFFNIIRPADILYHVRKSGKPFVVSSLLVDYSGYDKNYRKGIAGFFFRLLSSD